MTLLVADLAVPTLGDSSSVSEFADKLNDDTAKFISFFISFAVIGRYWLAHHTYFSALARIDRSAATPTAYAIATLLHSASESNSAGCGSSSETAPIVAPARMRAPRTMAMVLGC
jgi:hypothetical protein